MGHRTNSNGKSSKRPKRRHQISLSALATGIASPAPPTPPLEASHDDFDDSGGILCPTNIFTGNSTTVVRRSSLVNGSSHSRRSCSPTSATKSVSFQLPNGQITSPVKDNAPMQFNVNSTYGQDNVPPKQIPLTVIPCPATPPTPAQDDPSDADPISHSAPDNGMDAEDPENEFLVPLFHRAEECAHMISHPNNQHLLGMLRSALGDKDYQNLMDIMLKKDRSDMDDREWIHACHDIIVGHGPCYYQAWKELVGIVGQCS